MHIYIPSRSRYTVKSLTLERIIGGWPDKLVHLVVPTDQAKLYASMPERRGIEVLPCPAKGIARTREWIGQNAASEKFLMLDDDLRFFYRPKIRPLDDPLEGAGKPNDSPVRLYRSKPEHIRRTFEMVEKLLDRYVHVAIGAREGNQRLPVPLIECSRPLRALAYRRDAFNACEHARVAIMEDFDVTLQLLRKGCKNAIITCYSQDQYLSQLPGGCSDYRTHEIHERNVRRLAKLHSPFVATRAKKNIHGGEFGNRLEATIAWKAAYQSALKELGI